MLSPWEKSYDKRRQHIKKQKHNFFDKVGLVKAMLFPVVMYDMKVGPERRLTIEELMFLNCGVGEDS